MKKILFSVILMATMSIFAQNGKVGIGNTDPKASLDITAEAGTTTTADGIIAPRLTGNQLAAKDAVYLAAQTGAQVYVTEAATVPTGKTINVTAPGYYYFDGTVWQVLVSSNNLKNIYTENGTLPASTNRQVTLADRIASKLSIAPAGEFANISTLNVVGGNSGGGVTSGITIASNYTDSTNKLGIIKVPQFLNASPPVQVFTLTNSATSNLLHIGGNNSGSQASASEIGFIVDGDADLSNSSNSSYVTAMTIKGITGNVGIGNTDPKASLDVTSTTSGVLIPRYTSTARTALTLSASQDGLVVYDTDEDCLYTYKHGSPATWVSYCKKPFSIYAVSNQFTALGQVGATLNANSNNALNLPLTWSIESTSGDISNVSIAANNPTTTATITYDVPTTTTNNGNALIIIKAVDATGQIEYTTSKITTSIVVSKTSLACNGDLSVNNVSLVNTKLNLFAKTSLTTAYTTYLGAGNPGNVNVVNTGDLVNALVDPSNGGTLKTWTATTSGGTGNQNVNPPTFMVNNPSFNSKPTLNFTAANSNALGIVTGNGSGAFKLVFLARIPSGATNGGNACVISAIPSSSLGAIGNTSNSSWQVGRDDFSNSFIFRAQDAFVTKNSESVVCPSCNAGEVAFATWQKFIDGKSHLVVVDYDGTVIKGYFDGALVFTVTSNATHKPTGNQFRIGTNRGNDSYVNMELSELIIGKPTMTTQELIEIQGYFLCKYGLDASLLAHASPFSINNSFYDSPSQFVLQVDGLGTERVYDQVNNAYYQRTNVPTPGLGYFSSPEINAIKQDYIINAAPGAGANQIIFTRGNGTTFTVTVP